MYCVKLILVKKAPGILAGSPGKNLYLFRQPVLFLCSHTQQQHDDVINWSGEEIRRYDIDHHNDKYQYFYGFVIHRILLIQDDMSLFIFTC